MRRKATLTIALAALSLLAFSPSSWQNVYGASYGFNPALATSISEWDQQKFTTLQWQGVDWVIFYGGFSKDASDYVHRLGMKAMVYVTALKEPASSKNGIVLPDGTTVTSDQSWAQYDPGTGTYMAGTYMYPDPVGREIWFSPYGPYVDQVTIPRIKQNLQLGADGIFLDTLILYPNADDNPTYADPVWKTQYSGMTYQQFRYQSLHDAAKKIFTALKNQNPNAVLIISDNNVCVQPAATESQLRDKFASAIDRWQDGADGFVLEYVGFIENNNPSDPIGEAQKIIDVWSREKSTYQVSKPMWVIGFTNRDDVFNYLKSNSVTQGFGYWTYDKYLLQPNLIIYQGQPFHISIQSNSSVSNLKFDKERRLINFSVTGADGTKGFANAIIPIALLDGSPIIMRNNQEISPSQLSQNTTHYIIRIDYHHSTQQITIGGAYAIPEFPLGLFLPISVTILLTALWITRKGDPTGSALRKLPKRNRFLFQASRQ